jgi:cell division protein FtsZ
LITIHGMVNLDFADVRTTMENGGTSLMGYATAAGEKRAERAARDAISSPLLDGISILGARNVLINITAGASLTMQEANAASLLIQREAGDDAEVIWGIVNDDRMGDDLRITVIATGFALDRKQVAAEKPTKTLTMPSQYKGEDSLRNLDEPAYARRGVKTTTQPAPDRVDQDEWREHRPAPAMPAVVAAAATAVAAAPALENPEPQKAQAVQLTLGPELGSNGNGNGAKKRKSTVRLMSPEDLDATAEISKTNDQETPAFLRRMMD